MSREFPFWEEVPSQFAALLRQMRDDEDVRLDATLATAIDRGWTCAALGRAIGATREKVGRLAQQAAERNDIPDVPEPRRPRHPNRQARRDLTTDEMRQLRELHEESTRVRGWHSPSHPARRASERLSELLNTLNGDGVRQADLATAMGVDPTTVQARLVRHGYRPSTASRANEVYRNAQGGVNGKRL